MASDGFPCDEFNFRHAFKLFYGDSPMLPSVNVDVPLYSESKPVSAASIWPSFVIFSRRPEFSKPVDTLIQQKEPVILCLIVQVHTPQYIIEQ